MATTPLSTDQLQSIADKACETALGPAESYTHGSVNDWNNTIIKTILESLIAETSTEKGTPPFKFIVNSTIIQHVHASSDHATSGRRGMHSAVGAFWNEEKDGTWSYKWQGAEQKGMDIVVVITWIGIGP